LLAGTSIFRHLLCWESLEAGDFVVGFWRLAATPKHDKRILQMMNQYFKTGLVILLVVIMGVMHIACEKENTRTELIEALEGRWKVEESSELLGTNSYFVSISIFPGDSSKIFISNFYGLDNENATARVQDSRIILNTDQKINVINATYVIKSGTGIISDDYQSIEWTYQVADGSGAIDHVEAFYEKM
jgi:hypothetical protein